jgi:hypothetical protein
MLANYDNPSIGIEDIIGYGGLGPSGAYEPRTPTGLPFHMGGSNLVSSTIALAAQNLGYDIFAGISKGGRVDDTKNRPVSATSKPQTNANVLFLEKQAKTIAYFDSDLEAINYLKKVVASGYPVEVHLNVINVMNDFASESNDWVNKVKANASHPNYSLFMVVTGYDANRIYLNDPTAPSKPTNLSLTIDRFLSAWNVPADMAEANIGPYWMIYIGKDGERKSVNDILIWNKQVSSNVTSDIRRWAENTPGKIQNSFPSQITQIPFARSAFADFLNKNGKYESASLYEQSSKLWLSLTTSNTAGDVLKRIADLEEQASGGF